LVSQINKIVENVTNAVVNLTIPLNVTAVNETVQTNEKVNDEIPKDEIKVKAENSSGLESNVTDKNLK
jgi:hypothetical protein